MHTSDGTQYTVHRAAVAGPAAHHVNNSCRGAGGGARPIVASTEGRRRAAAGGDAIGPDPVQPTQCINITPYCRGLRLGSGLQGRPTPAGTVPGGVTAARPLPAAAPRRSAVCARTTRKRAAAGRTHCAAGARTEPHQLARAWPPASSCRRNSRDPLPLPAITTPSHPHIHTQSHRE